MDLKPRDTDFADRFGDYVEIFDDELDPCDTITPLVHKIGGLLETIFGADRVQAGMKIIMEPIADDDGPWREDLYSGYYSEFAFTEMLTEVAAYGRYGIFINAKKDEPEDALKHKLAHMIASASDFLDQCPLDHWLGENRPPQLENAALLARGRWALDHGKPIEAQALAKLGGVSWGRMRNMISGKGAAFNAEGGMIPAHEAIDWLANRDDFYPSIWRTARPAWDDIVNENALQSEDPVFVPAARDGEVFHPGLKRSGQFTVGAKGEEVRYARFEDALDALTRMTTPRWRRPGKGHSPSWSLVSGVEWKRSTMTELQGIAESMQAMRAGSP